MFSSTTHKSILRKKYLEERSFFSREEIDEISLQLLENFKKTFEHKHGQNVHIFLPIEKFKEINTRFFIDYFWSHHMNVFIPKMMDDKIISVKLEPHTELIKNSWGILEPKSLVNEEINFDFVITPLVYCDSIGNRIGYGKGFYDRFFREINPDAKKIGVNYFTPNEFIKDVSAEDIRLDYLVTPTEVLSFS